MYLELLLCCQLDFPWRLWYEGRVDDERSELKVRLVAGDEIGWYNALMAEHHALGVAASGRVLRYVAEMDGVPLVLGTFGSAAWRVPVRDEFIGWDPVQRGERLERVVSNQRLCVLPAAEQVPHAASRALAAMLRRLPAESSCRVRGLGRRRASRSPTRPPHAGTTYAACGFTGAGRTAGFGRSRGAAHFVHHGQPKAYSIKELAPGGITALAAAFDSRPLTGRPGPGLQHPQRERGQGPAGVSGPGDRPPQAEGGTARPGRDPDRDRGRPPVRGGLRLRGRAVREVDAAGSAGPLRHPVQQAAREVRAAVPEDDQAGRPQDRRGRRR